MSRKTTDHCVIMRHKIGNIDGIVILQVDDSLTIFTTKFMEDGVKEAQNFGAKPRTIPSKPPIIFNGSNVILDKNNGTITIKQLANIMKL